MIFFDPFEIRIALGNDKFEFISCASEEELIEKCYQLARSRMLFRGGGGMDAGPAADLLQWQANGKLKISFLRISWVTSAAWQVHEIIPNNRNWVSIGYDEIVKKKPISIVQESERPSWIEYVKCRLFSLLKN